LEINAKNVRQWSRLGTRGFFGQVILDIASDNQDLLVLSADLGSSSGLERFRIAYPEQFINVGIAEQNMIGVAGGLAKEGFNVFATSFAPFISMRASEQVRMNLGYMHLNVKAVSIGSGIAMGFLGNSHFGLEDLAVMRTIPNLTVISPADCAEVLKVVEAAAIFKGPMYIRLTGSTNTPIVYEDNYEFKLGKAIILRKGVDINLVACGSMVYHSLKVAELLLEQGISAGVINMHTIKPLDLELLDSLIKIGKPIVTLEEHTIIGGLGSAVAEYISPKTNRPPHMLVGLPDAYLNTGEYNYMLEEIGLTANGLQNRILNFLNQVNT
jgi:transketolase